MLDVLAEMGYIRSPTTLRATEDDVMDKPEFSRKWIEETAKAADVISRAKAASPVAGGKDRLGSLDPGFRRLNGL